MPRSHIACFRFSAIFAAALGFLTTQATADEVVLKLKNGGLTLTGKLLEFDGTNYRIDTEALGVIMVSKNKFTCTGDGCPKEEPKAADAPKKPADDGTIEIAGSTTIGARLLPELVEDYAAQKGATVKVTDQENGSSVMELVDKDGATELTFKLERKGSAAAFPALAAGEAEIGASDRPITDQEIGALAAAGHHNMNRPEHEYVIGLDGIVVFASPRSRVEFLSALDIARLFSGEIRDWSELGFASGPVSVYATSEDTGTFATFNSLALKPFKRNLTSSAKRFSTNDELVEALAQDPGGIGFASFAEVGKVKPITIKDTCGLTHKASDFGVKSGEYPLSRKLYFYTTAETGKSASDFVDFTIASGSQALREAGFIDKGLVKVPFDNFRDRAAAALDAAPEDFNLELMRQLKKELGEGERLSATMRFVTGSALLDSDSVEQIPGILAYLKKSENQDKKVLLAGFSDASGWFDNNKQLSLARAEGVRNALVANSNGQLTAEEIEVRGYGELFPMACNDTETGRRTNRRVEIWLVPGGQSRPVVLTKQP